jgi:hypothetical protein
VLGVMLTAIAIPGAASSVVTRATITVNRGATGVALGMTRAQVTARLGRPVGGNGNWLQYGPRNKPWIVFDVYLDRSKQPARVRLIGLHGAGFCLPEPGPCLEQRGGVGKLKTRYGKALRIVKLEDGEQVARLTGTVHDCKVFTDFGAPISPNADAKIGMTFIGFLSGSAC